MSEGNSKPRIFDYFDYRDFLRDIIAYSRARGEFSVRKFARAAGFSSQSYLKMVLDQKRNLTKSSVEKIGTAFQLSPGEKRFFHALTALQIAKTTEERSRITEEMSLMRRFYLVHPLHASAYENFSEWYIPVIIEALQTRWAKRPIKEMAASIGISENQLLNLFERLRGMNLIESTLDGWIVKHSSLETPLEMGSEAIKNLHKEMISKALHALSEIPDLERSMNTMTIALTRAGFQKMKEEIFEFHKRLSARYQNADNPDAIYEFNSQLFPIMKI